MNTTRRGFLSSGAALGAGFVLSGCNPSRASKDDQRETPGTASANARTSAAPPASAKADDQDAHGGAEDVSATEDLMREHGVIRRALVVYRESAARLRANAASVPPEALASTAKLLRAFGEDYHERKLEEAIVFPDVKAASGAASDAVNVLGAQHDRGRAITDYVLAVVQAPKIGANAKQLADALEGFARMYDAHAAIEDTVVFPAWKKTRTRKQLAELAEKFEEIEHATFGKDGFDDALKQIAAIEASLGLADLAKLTAPSPPKAK